MRMILCRIIMDMARPRSTTLEELGVVLTNKI